MTPEVGRRPDAAEAGATPVSVIVPARNAGALLPAALDSVLAQRYAGAVEVIVADGSAGTATRDLLRRRFPGVRRVANPDRTIPAALNRALAAARHPVVARLDVRAMLPPEYLARAVETLRRTGAANVGGRLKPVGAGPVGRAVALASGAWIGAGAARYRVGGSEGPVDTVYPGVYRRDALEAAGGWDETLLGNEDYELNWRLRVRGETVWFDPALTVNYRPRTGLRALARQYYSYGRWKRVALAREPRMLRPRQLAAPVLLLALAASVALAATGALAASGAPAPWLAPARAAALIRAGVVAPLGYALALVAAAAWLGIRHGRLEALLLPAVAATMHLAWALGFFVGVRGVRP